MDTSIYQGVRGVLRDAARTAAACAEILARYRRTASIALVNGRLVADARTPVGAMYVHLLDLGVGRPLYTGLEYEREETTFLRHTLKPDMTVIDVGANVGYMSLLASRAVGRDGRVLAIEPDPGNARLLQANTTRNSADNVSICCCAVGSEPGSATLYQSAWNMGNHRLNAGASGRAIASRAITVAVKTVDQLVGDNHLARVDVVKMDIEGYEPGALAGMSETIGRDHPVILTEFWPFAMRDAGFDPAAFIETLLAAGYEARAFPALDRPMRNVSDVLGTLPDHSAGTYTNLVFADRRAPVTN